MAGPIKVDTQSFQNKVLGSEKPVLVDFWAEWCAPCRALEPIVEELSREFDGQVVFAKLNVDENPEIAQEYGVYGIPTMIVFDKGKEESRIIGLRPKTYISQALNKVAAPA
ncbi:MAG: thioredoxin [Chloroflexi bacterium]|nr:thioredoxin [Chloroflexota bacterium]